MQDILAALQAQVDAWNRGDLEAFADGYWRSDRTVFASGDQVHRGFAAMLQRYREAYPTREKMGTLAFSEIQFEDLSPDRAVMTGSWRLSDGARGVFTLIWRRFPDGWKIVHDHTSRK
jgi:beta-aspartyl-peptidase (threonine type)